MCSGLRGSTSCKAVGRTDAGAFHVASRAGLATGSAAYLAPDSGEECPPHAQPAHRRMDALVKAIAHRPGTQQTQPVPPSGSQPAPLLHRRLPPSRPQAAPRTDGLLRVGIGLRGLRGAPSIYAALRSPRRRTKVSAGVGGAEGNGHPAPTKSGIFALLCFPQIGLG